MEKQMTAEELVKVLNGGEWVVCGGREIRDEKGFTPLFSVVKASMAEGKLSIATDVRTFEVPSDRIVLVEEWLIEVRCEFMSRQQRKKVDGGGFVEVPTIGVALRLKNPAMEEAAKKAQEAAARQREEERQQREATEREANERAFDEKLMKQYGGKKLVGVTVMGGNLSLTFKGDDGTEEVMFIDLAGGDLYDAWINVNEISLCTFEFNRD